MLTLRGPRWWERVGEWLNRHIEVRKDLGVTVDTIRELEAIRLAELWEDEDRARREAETRPVE